MRARRSLLVLLVVAAVAAAALPATAGPLETEIRASAGTDGSASLQVGEAGVDADADRAVEAGGDLVASAGGAATGTFSGTEAGGGPQVDSSSRIHRGTAGAVSTAAGAASLAALAAYAAAKLEGLAWLRRGAGLAVVPLYSRLDRSEILENETRREMYELVQDEAGISMQRIADEVGCGWGTVVYHLEKLEDEDFVVSQRTGGRRRFFAAGDVSQDEKEAVGVLRQDTPREIVAQLLRDPGCNQSEICEALDIAASTASKHLGRLEEADLVEREREWREVHYFPAEGLAERVPSAPDHAGAGAGADRGSPAPA